MPRAASASGGAQGGDEVHAGVGAERARRPLRAHQHDRLRDPQGQVEEEPGLLQGRGAVRDDETGDAGIVVRDAVDQRAQFQPVRRADRGAADLAKGDRQRIGNEAGLGKAVEEGCGSQLLAELGIVEDIEAAGAERGDRAAGADDGDAGKGGHWTASTSSRNEA